MRIQARLAGVERALLPKRGTTRGATNGGHFRLCGFHFQLLWALSGKDNGQSGSETMIWEPRVYSSAPRGLHLVVGKLHAEAFLCIPNSRHTRRGNVKVAIALRAYKETLAIKDT